MVLLVVATIMYRGFQRQLGTGPGYRADHLLIVSFDPSLVRYTEPQSQQFFERLAERAREAPGSSPSRCLVSAHGYRRPRVARRLCRKAFNSPKGRKTPRSWARWWTEFFFDTMRLTILKGRGFRATDSADAPRSRSSTSKLASHYWPNQDPLGKRFRLDSNNGPWVEIVGLAQDQQIHLFLAEAPIEVPVHAGQAAESTIDDAR